MKIIKTIVMGFAIISIYLLLNTTHIKFDVQYLCAADAFILTVIIPLFVTLLSLHSLNIFNELKELRLISGEKYYNIWVFILKKHKNNILKTYAIVVIVSIITFLSVYTDKSAWGPSVALFILSSLYTAIQCLLILDIIIKRIDIKMIIK